MQQLKEFIRSQNDGEFKNFTECYKIVSQGKKEEQQELFECISEFLKTDQTRYISHFSLIRLCYQLTKKSDEVFNFECFQETVLPSIKEYIFKNQFYSKAIDHKAQQYILSSVTLCKELLGYWAHAFPQTKDQKISKFLIEYLLFREQQNEINVEQLGKKNYNYLKPALNPNYKYNKKLAIGEIFKNKFYKSEEEKQQLYDNLKQKSLEIDELKLRISQLEQELQLYKQMKESNLQQVPQINQSTSTSDNSFRIPKSINESTIFNKDFNFDCNKQYIKKLKGKPLLYVIDISYPEKKQRLLDGRGVFHISENYQFARDYKQNFDTIDIAIYIKCNQNELNDLRVEIEENNDFIDDIYSNFPLQNNNLKPNQQALFEIRNIQKSKIYQQDLKINFAIDSREIIREDITFYFKILNLVQYIQKNEKDIIKEYHQCQIELCSELFQFDDEAFPNRLLDVQKCIQYSINYNNQSRQLFLSGIVNQQSFICKISLNDFGRAEVRLKKLDCDSEMAQRLIQAYIEALKKND